MYSRENYPQNRWGSQEYRENDRGNHVNLRGRYYNRNSSHYPDGEYYSDDWNIHDYGGQPTYYDNYNDRRYRRRNSSYNNAYDSDIYEREFVREDPDRIRRFRNEYQYRPNRRDYRDEYPDDDDRAQRRYYNEDRYSPDRPSDYSRRNFFERAADRIRHTRHDWTGRDNDYVHRYPEDRNERRYGRDNWALNRNRGYATQQNRRYRELEW